MKNKSSITKAFDFNTVVLTATDHYAALFSSKKYPHILQRGDNRVDNPNWQGHHLHILNGDLFVNNYKEYVFNSFNNTVYRVIDRDATREEMHDPNNIHIIDIERFPNQYTGIVGSTDPKLWAKERIVSENKVSLFKTMTCVLPISDAFIDDYILYKTSEKHY